jgi:hypothetical protein
MKDCPICRGGSQLAGKFFASGENGRWFCMACGGEGTLDACLARVVGGLFDRTPGLKRDFQAILAEYFKEEK